MLLELNFLEFIFKNETELSSIYINFEKVLNHVNFRFLKQYCNKIALRDLTCLPIPRDQYAPGRNERRLLPLSVFPAPEHPHTAGNLNLLCTSQQHREDSATQDAQLLSEAAWLESLLHVCIFSDDLLLTKFLVLSTWLHFLSR